MSLLITSNSVNQDINTNKSSSVKASKRLTVLNDKMGNYLNNKNKVNAVENTYSNDNQGLQNNLVKSESVNSLKSRKNSANLSRKNSTQSFHNRSSLFTNYQKLLDVYNFLPISDFGIKEYINSRNFSVQKKCEEHKNSNLDYFCIECRKAVCMHCYNNQHRQHASVLKNPFIKNPNLEIFTSLDNSIKDFLLKSNPEDVKKDIIDNINLMHSKLQKTIDNFKTKKLNEAEMLYNQLINIVQDFNGKYLQAKNVLSTYYKQFESFFPNKPSDISFLQNFNIVNSALLLKKDSEEYVKNLINLNKDFSSETKKNYNNILDNIEKQISSINNTSEIKKVYAISNNFENFEKLIEANANFNIKYAEELEKMFKIRENLEFVPRQLETTFQAIKEINKVEKNNNRMSINVNSNVENKRKSLIGNDTNSRLSVVKQRPSLFTRYNFNNSLAEKINVPKIMLDKDVKWDNRLFDLAYIHFVNTGQIKWDDFISFASDPNEQLFQNRKFIKELQLKNYITPMFLTAIDDYNKKISTEPSSLKKEINSTQNSFRYDDKKNKFVDIKVQAIEGTNFIKLFTKDTTAKVEINLKKIYNEYLIKIGNLDKEIFENKFVSMSTIKSNNESEFFGDSKGFNSINNKDVNRKNTNKSNKNVNKTLIKTKTLSNTIESNNNKELKKSISTIKTIREKESDNNISKYMIVKDDQNYEKHKRANSINSNSTDRSRDRDLKANMSNKHSRENSFDSSVKNRNLKTDKKTTDNLVISEKKKNDSLENNYVLNSPYYFNNKCDLDDPYRKFPYGVRTIIVNDEVYLIGGKDSNRQYSTIISYNLKTKESKFIANMINKRSYCSLAFGNNMIYIIGGECNKSCEALSLDNLKCILLPDLVYPRADCSLYVYKNTLLYAFSGFKKGIHDSDPNNLNNSIERMILLKDAILRMGIYNSSWEKVNFMNFTGLDLRLEFHEIFSPTDNYVISQAYSERKNTKITVVFDVVKHELHDLSAEIMRKLRKILVNSEELTKLIEESIN